MLALRGKKPISLTGVFSGKVISFTNEPSMWRPFAKNYFVDDGNIQLDTNRFDKNTYCTVSGGNLVYSFSFLRNWSIQLYSALMYVLHSPRNSRQFRFITKKYIKRYFALDVGFIVLKLQIYFSQNILFVCCDIFFLKVWLSACILNMFH